MELNIEVCRFIAVRYGLPLQFVVKEFHLMNVLGQIAEFVSSRQNLLVFKGGTALNKVYLQKMQRFSEDADFDLVTRTAKKDLLKFCKELAYHIEGYEIEEFRRVGGTMQFYCTYENPLGGKDHVRIDVAPKKLITSKRVESRTAVSEFTQASVSGIIIYSIEDLTARKLNALAERAEGKDVYDVNAALPLCSTATLRVAIERMLESEGAKETAPSFMEKVLRSLEKANSKKLRNLTNPFIPVAYRPRSWEELKNNLLLKLESL
jgi:predicted nucleotidyltransferase component of viral defense system